MGPVIPGVVVVGEMWPVIPGVAVVVVGSRHQSPRCGV